MDRAADFLIPTDHRIQLARPGRRGEIPAVLFQGFVGALRVLIVHGLATSNGLNGILELFGGGTALGEQLLAAAIIDGQGQEKVLDGDEAVAIAGFERLGLIQHAIEAFAQIHRLGRGTQAGLGGDEGLHLLAQGAQFHPGLFKDSTRQALLGQQGGKQMLALHLLLAFLLRQLLGAHHGTPGFFSEQFGGGIHGSISSSGGVAQPYGR